MNLLLDTNVLSEARRPSPDPRVMSWLHTLDEDRVYISAASIAELRRGIMLMDSGRRRQALTDWLAHDLPARFSDRILPIDPAVALCWGDLMADSKTRGVALSVMDGFIGATARAHDMILATRNTKDFAPFEIALFNPWDETPP